ncbi:DUF523 and DUF1722 domain-containing protein [Paraclostridium ghonii]|uniref:DUF523 and DUF1722 domain-containing protein n=1 Tax=Paraclostridium ghonii TaxID=29358 RepID=UPI00202CF1C4|nr:DUF523 and DUF1722 domain-containing protein [Paeniclostridium ghonii]MCM0164945.1 DUF523 and DUF1722 domain-containing protein [Paeniclostridium ghonii]
MRRPKLLISKCLGFENCRYNGQGASSKLVDSLKKHVDFCTVCPEVEIGLQTPREVIRIVDYDNEKKLIQPKTNKDHTEKMKNFSKNYISNLDDIDGCILKSKSPSCGIKDVKVYHKNGKSSLFNGSNGFFAQEILNSYGHLPIENEGRLKNYSIRDEFLTKLFMINNFKDDNNTIEEFHEKNELLLRSYDIKIYNELDCIYNKGIYKKKEYEIKLFQLLNSNRNARKNIQTILDIYNKYEAQLSMKEKEVFVDIVVKYSKGKLPISAVLSNMKIYAARFEDESILNQTLFNPYPEGLIDLTDSGKGRSL